MTRQFLRRFLLAAALVLTVGAHASAVAQESANSAAFWLQEESRFEHRQRPAFRQPTRVRRLVPNAKLARPTIWRSPERMREPPAAGVPAETAPAATPPPADAAPQPGLPAPDTQKADGTPAAPPPQAATLNLLLIGDNVGYFLGQGLAEAQAEAGGGARINVVRKTRDSSGLVRDDFYDWPKNLKEILAGPEKFDALAIMLGSNDRQELRDAAGRNEPLSPHWRDLYAARVDAILAIAKERGLPVFWVGLPIMRAERYSSEIGQLNDIFRARTEEAGGKFVDIWDAFADENGKFSVFGPDVNGQTVKLRTSDGIHFTKAGARKLAYFFDQSLRPMLEKPRPQESVAVLPAPSGETPPAQSGAPAAPAVVPEAPAPPPPKPLAGPIVPLTAPALAPDERLAGDDPHGPAPSDYASGAPAPAQPGRADDFSWPRR